MINKKTGAKIVDLFEALKQSLERPMTTGFCPDCSEVHEVPERDGYEGTCGECGCDFITDIDAGEDGEACFRLIRRLCQRCVAGVCSEYQPVDASDEYGILVQDGGVYLMKRKWMGLIRTVDWGTHVRIVDVNGPLSIDPARIYKVTSQPRGPLKVPSKQDMKDDLKAQEKEFGELSGDYDAGFTNGTEWAIDWIKKANGAE